MAKEKAKKVILIGIDSLMTEFVRRFVKQGRMPNLKKLINSGVWSNAWPCLPTLTPTNWATVATGANTSTHGVTDFDVPISPFAEDQIKTRKQLLSFVPPEMYAVSGFDSRVCQAEHIWVTAEREGKKSILLRYPGAWPPNIKKGIVAFNGTPASSIWAVSDALSYTNVKEISEAFEEGLHGMTLNVAIDLKKAMGWKDLPQTALPPLESVIVIKPAREGETKELNLLVYATSSRGYDWVLISKNKDGKNYLVNIGVGEWSNFIRERFIIEGREREATMRFRVLELSSDAKRLVLWRSQVHLTNGFSYPPSISGELIRECGPYFDNPGRFLLGAGWPEIYLEEVEYHNNWLAKAANYLMSHYDWDLFFTQVHSPDFVKHEIWNGLDPESPKFDQNLEEKCWNIMARDYELMDEYVGKVIKEAERDTLIVVLSDHGHYSHNRTVLIINALVKAGLIHLKPNGEIDLSKTKAYGGRSGVWVSLKGRKLLFPEGIVNPGREYEEVRNQIIDVLLSIKDPETGVHPVALALKREDAAILGMNGERNADVLLVLAPGYDVAFHYLEKYKNLKEPAIGPEIGTWGRQRSTHGRGLPCAKFSIGTMEATFIMSGPGVRRGYERPKPIWLMDVAPTIAHLLGISRPPQAEGDVVYDFLE